MENLGKIPDVIFYSSSSFFFWEQEKCRFILFRVLKQVSFISFSFDIGEIGSRRGRWTRRERNDRIVIAFALRY